MAKAHTLVDNFNDDQTNTALWAVSPPGDFVRETNGRVEVRPRSNQPGTYVYYTPVPYDVTESSFAVEVVRAATGPDVRTGIALLGLGGNVNLWIQNGGVEATYIIAAVTTVLARVAYDPAVHRWLRVREWTGTTYWETSADGCTWVVLAQAPDPISLTAVHLYLGAEEVTATPAPGTAVLDNANVQNTPLARRVEQRRRAARDVRVQAAQVAAARPHDEHANNNDEANYPGQPLIGNYTKGLRHDALGDPEPGSYTTLLRALQSEDPADFEEITLGILPPDTKRFKLTNPQAGLAFDIAGPDAQERTIPPAPRFDSEVAAHEMGELYWMGLARDVPFTSYGSSPVITAAINSLNTEFPRFGGTAPVTAQNVFRGIYPGEQVGPYVSQFLLKGNADPRKLDGFGRDADEGFISYGARTIDQRLRPARSGRNWMGGFDVWLAVQNGVDRRGMDEFEDTRVFIHTLRDGATFVHFDQVVDAFYNAAWLLMSEPEGDQLLAASATGRPQIDGEFPKDPGNPYDPPGMAMDSRTQSPFATFGPPHLLQALSEVLGRALRATWWQKWGVHRRLRPEEYGGRVHNHVSGARTYPLHDSIVDSLQSGGGLAPYVGPTGSLWTGNYLLRQAYPEGAPTHPAYAAGHATGSGACATILKAFFDESKAFENPRQASADGLTLVPYAGTDAAQMTVGGELNKLAGNVALFRNGAGVHWRSDYTESLPLGEAIAIGLLQEMSLGFNEDDAFFELTKFDGQRIRIFDGTVVPVVV
ncbi:MAG TPA: vanadium-dependent haloperoxidase [Longimicrobium sp.]|nr:vanadium-dependent haloperoxidase [Longimicrobium sp.]